VQKIFNYDKLQTTLFLITPDKVLSILVYRSPFYITIIHIVYKLLTSALLLLRCACSVVFLSGTVSK